MKNTGRVFLTDVLRCEPIAFDAVKTLDEHLKKVDRDEIVYEDEHVVAYLQGGDEDSGSTTHWTHRFVVALKGHVPTLLDLDVCDGRSTGALLRAVQAIAFKFKLYESGFEIRCDVLPPLQRKGFLEIKLRSGKLGSAPHGEAPPAGPANEQRPEVAP